MTFGQDPFNPSRTVPTLAAIQHRRRELLAYQGRQVSGPKHKTRKPARTPPNPTLMAHKALKAHTSTRSNEATKPGALSDKRPCSLLAIRRRLLAGF
jgi:hypothetical protein